MELAYLLLILAALLSAWYTGSRWGAAKSSQGVSSTKSIDYYQGLNFLINEQPDASLDTFIDSLDVTPDTLETHLAFGALMRKRGEVERAIRVHQNLLSRSQLSQDQRHQAQLALARDFMAAGLFDRAERLLLDLVDMSDQCRHQALRYLVEIYRDEQEWEKAIRAADQLRPKRLMGRGAPPMAEEQAHFCCELAELALSKGELLEMRRHLRLALKYDKQSVRASLLWGRLELKQSNYKEALKQFDRIANQSPEYLSEVVADICHCYEQLNQPEALRAYLAGLLKQHSSGTLLLALAERLRETEGDQQALDFLGEHLSKSSSLKGLLRLVEWHLPTAGAHQGSVLLLKESLDKLLASRPTHRCGHCGFSGRELHWLCPKCKTWGSSKPIRGLEGE